MRKIAVFITSIFLILTSTITNAATVGGWVLSNPKPQGASTLYDASKTVLDKTRKSTALITPNSSQVAKVLRGGVAGYALSVAVEQLLGAVDWVLDPVNNRINYQDPLAQINPNSPQLKYYYELSIITPHESFKDLSTLCLRVKEIRVGWGNEVECIVDLDQQGNETNRIVAIGLYGSYGDIGSRNINPEYNPSAPNNEKSISLETVAQRVITNAGYNDSNAQAATSAAAENMATDAEADEDAAQPIKEQLENNAVDVGSGDPNDPDDEPENNGKQAKHLNDKQIGNLVGNSKWHKTKLKDNIKEAYKKQLKGSKNFDFYRDPKTGDIFIKGNQSKEMIYINLERFL